MDKFIKLIKQNDLTNQYDQIEYCGTSEPSLDDYYFCLDKNEFDDLASALGVSSDMDRQDLRNKILTKQFKDLYLLEVDSLHDSLTGYFKELYGGVDGILSHYGYLDRMENPDIFYNDLADDIEDTFNINDTGFSGGPDFDEPDPIPNPEPEPEPEPEPVAEIVPAFTDTPKPSSYEDMVTHEMIRLITAKLGVDFDNLKAEAEQNVDFRLNPILTEEKLNSVLDELVKLGVYSEVESDFYRASYLAGQKREVTAVLENRCRELMNKHE